jgi:hypothetical protein
MRPLVPSWSVLRGYRRQAVTRRSRPRGRVRSHRGLLMGRVGQRGTNSCPERVRNRNGTGTERGSVRPRSPIRDSSRARTSRPGRYSRTARGSADGARRREARRPLVDAPLGCGKSGADRPWPRACRDGGRSALRPRRRDHHAGVHREEPEPEQPRDEGRFDDESVRQPPSRVGNRDQVRRRRLSGARCIPRIASTPSRPP